MKAVFDLDDTISVHKNRDYENAQPIPETIERMRALKAAGWEICIYSARGQHSCNGDIALIEKRNRSVVEKWLSKQNVPFDELLFGKPLGDLYVDDKGMSLEAFLSAPVEKLYGNSGSDIQRVGNCVYKKAANAAAIAEWYKTAASIGINTPKVHSVVLDTLYMEYIDGTGGGSKEITKSDIYALISTIMLFSLKKSGYSFNPEALIDRAKEHLLSYRLDGSSRFGFKPLFDYMRTLFADKDYGTFCHGDFSLSNTIFSDNKIWLIDPIPSSKYSSYLMDFAKLRFSLDGGEEFLHGSTIDYSAAMSELDRTLRENELWNRVIALEAVYWIRLLKYTEPERRERVVSKALELQAWL